MGRFEYMTEALADFMISLAAEELHHIFLCKHTYATLLKVPILRRTSLDYG